MLPNRFRATFAVQRLPLWAECEVGVVRDRRVFKAEERQALADSLRAETLGCIHCAPKKQARRAQLIGMGASTPSRVRRDRRGIGAPCVLPNRFRAAFAVQRLPLWAECVVGVVRGGGAAGVGRLTPHGDSRLQGGGRKVARRACSQICSALRSLSNACRSGRSVWREWFEAGELSRRSGRRVQGDSLRAETLGCKDVGSRSCVLRTAE